MGGDTEAFVVGISGASYGVLDKTHGTFQGYSAAEGSAWASDSRCVVVCCSVL